jgi:hypothetical protein
MTGRDADALSASFAEGSRNGRAQTVKIVLPALARIEQYLAAAIALGLSGDAQHNINTSGNSLQACGLSWQCDGAAPGGSWPGAFPLVESYGRPPADFTTGQGGAVVLEIHRRRGVRSRNRGRGS